MAEPLISFLAAVSQFAPSLMRFVGAGEATTAIAGKVSGIVQAVTGKASPDEALAALKANEELQANLQRWIARAYPELERLYVEDRQDARRRDVALVNAGRHNVRADVMVIGAVLGLIACLVSLVAFRAGMPGEVVGIISTVAGIFGACLRDAFQFEFGSSRGSRDKDELLAQFGAAAPGIRKELSP